MTSPTEADLPGSPLRPSDGGGPRWGRAGRTSESSSNIDLSALDPDPHPLTWRTSSHSGGGGGNCVEVAQSDEGVHVRDTTRRADGTLVFSPQTWSHFVTAVRSGSQFRA